MIHQSAHFPPDQIAEMDRKIAAGEWSPGWLADHDRRCREQAHWERDREERIIAKFGVNRRRDVMGE